ncbi:MAG: Dna[CI] antecedent, DciA [Thermotogaceae bacterium]|jgi:predicted nucleic acid-binding Zn ribbon protein|nr:Dna[CI] antecedent, DciA [Thermotogaceae bacterium]MDN5336969.1 Dna[CI] antecedent, DciA [Thermotogaceae bacterium]
MRIGRIFFEAAKQNDFFKKLFLKTVLNDWESIVGKILAQKTFPLKLENGTLIIAHEDPLFASELILRKREIIDRLNAKLEGVVTVNAIKLIRRSEESGR